MAFWNKKTASNILIKYLEKENITVEKEEDAYSFVISFGEYNLFPYISFDNYSLNLMINLRKIKDGEDVLSNINAFNTRSPYFVAKLKDGIIYLEYNAIADNDNVIEVFKNSIGSLNNLKADIDSL